MLSGERSIPEQCVTLLMENGCRIRSLNGPKLSKRFTHHWSPEYHTDNANDSRFLFFYGFLCQWLLSPCVFLALFFFADRRLCSNSDKIIYNLSVDFHSSLFWIPTLILLISLWCTIALFLNSNTRGNFGANIFASWFNKKRCWSFAKKEDKPFVSQNLRIRR